MRRWHLLLSLPLLLLFPAAASAQTAPPLTLAAYWELLAETRAAVQQLQTSAVLPEAQAATLDQLAARLEDVTAVTLPSGMTVATQPSHLVRLLRADTPDLPLIEARLETILAQPDRWPQPQVEQLDAALLADILARPEFQYETNEPNAIQRFLTEARRRIVTFLFNLLPEGQTATVLGNLVAFAGLVGLAVLLAFALRGLFADIISETALVDPDDDGENLTASLALQRAETFSDGGDFRTAVRYLYLSSLLLLEERDLLRYDRALTNREYVRNLSNHPRLASILQEMINVFDRVWYGYQPLNADEYAAYVQRVEQLKRERETT